MVFSLEVEAHAHASRAKVPEIAAYLQEIFGQRLTAVIAGVHDPKAISAWAHGEREPRPEAEQRLRHAYHIARLLAQVEDSQTVRAWFMGMNPQLDDEAPALAVADKPVRVLQAARAFLAGG